MIRSHIDHRVRARAIRPTTLIGGETDQLQTKSLMGLALLVGLAVLDKAFVTPGDALND